MKRFRFTVLFLVLSTIFIAPGQKSWSQNANSTAAQPPEIKASTIIEELQAVKDRNPQIAPRELARLANQLLAVKHFPFS